MDDFVVRHQTLRDFLATGAAAHLWMTYQVVAAFGGRVIDRDTLATARGITRTTLDEHLQELRLLGFVTSDDQGTCLLVERAAPRPLRGNLFSDTAASVPSGSEPAAAPPADATRRVDTADDIRRVFVEEMCARHGAHTVSQYPMAIPGRSRRAFNEMLDVYAPDVIVSAVRVLVWDWEEAREQCWPKSLNERPALEHLPRYMDTLVAAVQTGLVASAAQRGRQDKYSDRFLRPRLARTRPHYWEWTVQQLYEWVAAHPSLYREMWQAGLMPTMGELAGYDPSAQLVSFKPADAGVA